MKDLYLHMEEAHNKFIADFDDLVDLQERYTIHYPPAGAANRPNDDADTDVSDSDSDGADADVSDANVSDAKKPREDDSDEGPEGKSVKVSKNISGCNKGKGLPGSGKGQKSKV